MQDEIGTEKEKYLPLAGSLLQWCNSQDLTKQRASSQGFPHGCRDPNT